jgi:hypothetical protein
MSSQTRSERLQSAMTEEIKRQIQGGLFQDLMKVLTQTQSEKRVEDLAQHLATFLLSDLRLRLALTAYGQSPRIIRQLLRHP